MWPPLPLLLARPDVRVFSAVRLTDLTSRTGQADSVLTFAAINVSA